MSTLGSGEIKEIGECPDHDDSTRCYTVVVSLYWSHIHRVHGRLDPTGCVGALPRSVKRILGLYNYIEPFSQQT